MRSFQFRGVPPYYTNSFMMISDENHAVIIDPAYTAQDYKQVLDECGATLVAIFCTHGHFDHVVSAMELRDAHGATLYCNPEDTRGNQLYPLSFADKGFADQEEISIDNMTFRVWRTPGHSEGSVCIKCENFWFTGDTLFMGSIGRTDLEGGEPEVMRTTLHKIIALAEQIPGETHVLPGHEAFSTFAHELATNWHLQEGGR